MIKVYYPFSVLEGDAAQTRKTRSLFVLNEIVGKEQKQTKGKELYYLQLTKADCAKMLYEDNGAGSLADWATSDQGKQLLSDGAWNDALSRQLWGHRRGWGRAYITRAVEDHGIQA